ncbi:unnamed protein product [Soboliphyme baturini]|uniref:Methionine--tRNA ligase, mitochondrial n=1 Tax=Soboliphyme baturini TaxID=241478 RepID=A0A183IQJ4_9BILA|nr:unnamed protein product [Soboliphyme baturini]
MVCYWRNFYRLVPVTVAAGRTTSVGLDFRRSIGYFVTTPIFYVNAAPHIGHLYSALLADASNRWYILKHPSEKTLFVTGSDEHGIKDVFRHFNISNSDFIRTTEERHVKAVTAFWNKLLESGSIYKAKYSGWYCVSDETYYSEREIEDAVMPDGTKAKVSTSSGHKVEWTTEENYLFALTKYESKLRKWLQESGVVQPSYIHQFLMNSFHNISDVSVSRQRDRCPWGIEVPGDASQTIYVWFDALVNYLTAAGYPNKITRWPPDCQLVGKDIIK